MVTPRTVVLSMASVALLMALTNCGSIPGLGRKHVIHSDSQQRVGNLTFQIVECASGKVLMEGTREVLARDVGITQTKSLGGGVFSTKRIDLDQGFYIELVGSSHKSREGIDGFGFTAGRPGYGSSWEWFDVDREFHAVKLQEFGEFTFTVVASGTAWEIGRTEVVKETSLRIFGWDPTAQVRNKPRWRVQLKPGSYVDWPSVTNGVVVLH